MSLKFYQRVIYRAWQEPVFRAKAWTETLYLLKKCLPVRLVTPRANYVYCRSIMEPDKGRWLPPAGLRLRSGAYGITFDEADRVLLVSDPFDGKRWSLPGGAVEPGETLEVALQREFVEETGLTVAVGAVVTNRDEFAIMPTGQPVHSVLHFYLVKVTGGILLVGGNDFDTGAAAYFNIDSLSARQLGGDEKLLHLIHRAHRLREFEAR